MLEIKQISKRYQYQKVLKNIDILFPHNGIVSIVGPSGCGKSTLLHIIGGIDPDFQGDILWNQKSVKRHLTRYRRQHVTFIFQQFHLIMWLSVMSNISLSRFFHRQEKSSLTSLDLKEFKKQKISSLSLGQRQRLAYLRGRAHRSDILLCDEPTGSLDPHYAKKVMELLKDASQDRLVIMVSHDQTLVKQYSDEIYEMKDGEIVAHEMRKHSLFQATSSSMQRRFFLSHWRLSLASLISHKGRSLQLVVGLCLSLVCIMTALTLTRHLEKQLTQYVYSLVPSSGISFQSRYHQTLTLEFLDILKNHEGIIKAEMFLDHYESLGIGFLSERYEQSQTLFIGDETSPYDTLPLHCGRYPQETHEIMLSLSTARHLVKENDVSQLLGKEIYAWYQHDLEVISIRYHIVGITRSSTTLDTLYQQDHAFIHLLKDNYGLSEEQLFSSLGILYVHQDEQRDQIIHQLQKEYPDYQFIAIGETTTQNISETIQKINIILFAFSCLAILSSLFLIGEVMFLNVVQKKKDLAIMKCYGASSWDLLKFVLYESLEILWLSHLLGIILYHEIIQLFNRLLEEVFGNDLFFIRFDIQLVCVVLGISYLLVFFSQIPPLIYVFLMNTTKALKE